MMARSRGHNLEKWRNDCGHKINITASESEYIVFIISDDEHTIYSLLLPLDI